MQNTPRNIYELPLPPTALADYEAFSKFMNSSERRCKESGRNFDMVLEWAIHALINSLASDSAARIFLPKTRTNPFYLDDLIPLSELPSAGTTRVSLRETNLIAPVWNNGDLMSAMEAFYDSGFQDVDVNKSFGIHIKELKLTIITDSSEVDLPYVLRVWGCGQILADTYTIRDLEPVLSTDGTDWFILKDNGSHKTQPVHDVRMAILYNCAMRRYGGWRNNPPVN